MWGIRVIIPSQLRERVLYELHTGHPGIVRTKSLARRHVWWPNLEGSDSIMQNSARFPIRYRTTPDSTTGQTPTELFLNRRLRTRLGLMRPGLGRKVFDRQTDQKAR